jgi:hypothetical protein
MFWRTQWWAEALARIHRERRAKALERAASREAKRLHLSRWRWMDPGSPSSDESAMRR